MVAKNTNALAALYLEDETAWLDATATLVRERDFASVDTDTLSEYLTDMATRDRREVLSRMVILLAHLLKWQFQPEKRTPSWSGTILEQAFQLESNASRGVLKNHAEAIMEEAYAKAVQLAGRQTDLPRNTFPTECPYTLDQLFAGVLPS